jgi:hypothetical protein
VAGTDSNIMNRLRSTLVHGGLLAVVALGLPACATILRVRDPSQRIMAMDREALEMYQAGDVSQAEDLLNEAVTSGRNAGLEASPVMAPVHLHLGAVLLSLEDKRQAMKNLGLALRIDPAVQPDATIANPELKKAMVQARTQIAHGRGPAALAAQSLRVPPRSALARGSAPVRESAPAQESASAPAHPTGPSAREATASAIAELTRSEPPSRAATPPPTPVPAKEAVPQPDADEPDLPAPIPQPLYCLLPDEAPPKVEIPLRCAARPGLSVGRVVLYYRTPGRAKFSSVPMSRSAKGWYQAAMPPTEAAAKSLQYYVEVRGQNNKVTTSNGQPDSPNLVLIRASAKEAGPAAEDAAVKQEVEEENPLAVLTAEHARAVQDAGTHRRARDAYWLGVGVGSGYGWHPARRLEFHDDHQIENGVSPAGLLQITPELGRQLGARYAVSVQLRLQLIPESGAGDNRPGAPAHTAFAVFLRGHRFFGVGNFQAFLTGTVGAGDGFRLVVPSQPDADIGRSDTIRGGPVALGPGAGLTYHFTRHFAWAVEARGLVGLPDFATLGELSTGAALAF